MSAYKQVESKSWIRFGLKIDHVNRDKADNGVENLRSIRHTEQFCYVVRKKMSVANGMRLSIKDVRYLRLVKEILLVKDEYKQSDFCNYYSKKFDRTYGTIEKVVNGVTYANLQLTNKE